MKIGIDLGGSHIGIGVVNDYGEVIEKQYRDFIGEEKKKIIKIMEKYIPEIIKEYSKKYDIEDTIGIAIPGTVDSESIIKSVNLGIENYNIVRSLESKTRNFFKIKNDGKCAALAENSYGSLQEYENSIFLSLGTGIGGAVIYNNRLLEANNYPGFEFGHIVIDKNGKQCKCGKRGCFETYCSMKAFKDELRNKLFLDNTTRGKEIVDIIKNEPENEVIKNVIDEYIENLAIGISNLINVFEPDAISIGGSFIHYSEILLPKLKDKLLNSDLLFNKRENIKINIAELQNNAGIIGATLI